MISDLLETEPPCFFSLEGSLLLEIEEKSFSELSMEENERYLGGFYSPMQLALNKWYIGAGIYATDKRLILTGVGRDMDATFKKMVTGSGRKDFDPSSLTPDQNQAIVKELSVESPKQIVFRKDQISSMEIKQPPGIFRTGHLRVLLTSGETFQLIISKKNEYERIFSLLQSFNSQILKQVT